MTDAFIYDQLSVYQHWKRNEATTRALLEPFQKESWAIGVRKGDDALRAEIDHALADFRANAGFEKLGNTWLKETKDAFRRLGVPFIF